METRAAAATTDYTEGVLSPRTPWSQAAAAAKEAWRAGITEAAGRDAYAKGVIKAGDAKWLKKAVELGSRRFTEGVSVATEDYKSGFTPYYDALSKLELPPRGPRGDPKNLDRVRAIVQTLRNVKTGTK